MPLITPRHVWMLLALICTGAVILSFGLTAWLDLNPCYLCIFQRTLFMLLALLAAATLPAWAAIIAAVTVVIWWGGR